MSTPILLPMFKRGVSLYFGQRGQKRVTFVVESFQSDSGAFYYRLYGFDGYFSEDEILRSFERFKTSSGASL